MYSYGTKYEWQGAVKRFTHIDQGPWAKEGVSYTAMLSDSPSAGDLDPDGDTPTGRIGTVTSMNPLLVGRSIKWDDATTFANGESVVKTANLTDGELDFGEIDGKSLCVFFMFKNTETGDNYYGPDKQTNSTDAGKRHFSYSILPWNGCWMSVNLCVPMPIKVSWSSTEDGEYTSVPCGTDIVFPGDDVWVKLELNTDFPLATLTGSEEIWYNCSSLLPLQTKHNAEGTDIENYDEYYIESRKYEGPIHLERNTVLRYAVYNGSTLKYGQATASGFDALGTKVFREEQPYSALDDKISLTYPAYDVQPIYTNLRNHYMWSNTFVKRSTETVPLTFTKSIPNSSWVEYLTGRYGLGSGAYTYQTYVPTRNLLIPSSLEGIVDFFIILNGNDDDINQENDYSGDTGTEPYLSRINWVPAGMPVIVRYRNYSAASPMEAPAAAAVNQANMLMQLTGENIGTEQERLPAYFLGPNEEGAYDIDGDPTSNCFDYNRDFSFKYYESGTATNFVEYERYVDENGSYGSYTNPLTGGSVCVNYPPMKDEDGNPLYYFTPDEYSYPPFYYKLNDDGERLYHAVNENGDKLYHYDDQATGNPAYQITDTDGKRLWLLLNGNGNSQYPVVDAEGHPLYYYKDESDNIVYHQLDGNSRPLFYVKDDEGNMLYHQEDGSGNTLYYEYYTAEGEKQHLYRVTDEDGNDVYQKVNGSGERLYAAQDENGDFLFQKIDADGNPLYYQRTYYGGTFGWVRSCYVTIIDGDNETPIGSMPEPAADQQVASMPDSMKPKKVPIEVPYSQLSNNGPSGDRPEWPVPPAEGDPSIVRTTTVPNAYPVIDVSSSSGVLACSTEQSVNTFASYFKLNGSGKQLYQKTNESGEALYHEVDGSGNPLYYAYYKDADNNDQFCYFAQDETGNDLYQKVDYAGNRLYYLNDENGDPLYQRADDEGNALYYAYALASTLPTTEPSSWLGASYATSQVDNYEESPIYGHEVYWSKLYNVSANVNGEPVSYTVDYTFKYGNATTVSGIKFPHPLLDYKLQMIQDSLAKVGTVTDFKAEPVIKPLDKIYAYFHSNDKFDDNYYIMQYSFHQPSSANSLYYGYRDDLYGHYNVYLTPSRDPWVLREFLAPYPEIPIDPVPADDEHPKCRQTTTIPNNDPVIIDENNGVRAYTTEDTGIPATTTVANSYAVETTTAAGNIVIETTTVTSIPLMTTEPTDRPDYSTMQTTQKDLSYATTTEENEWPVTITASDGDYTEGLAEVTTTTANAYPVVTTDDTGIPFLGLADASDYETPTATYSVDAEAQYFIDEYGTLPSPYNEAYTIDKDHPLTVNEDDYSTYDKSYLKAYTTGDSTLGYPPYCGVEDDYDSDTQGNSPDTSYPVGVTNSVDDNGNTLDPLTWSESYEERYKGGCIYTTEENGWPACDYEAEPLHKTWAMTTGTAFVDIDDFENANKTDYNSTMEPQTFMVYDGTSDRAFWYPEYQCYHLSSRDHRDEGNFYNVLHCLQEAKTVSEIEDETGGTVYGLTIDHKNMWIATNYDNIVEDYVSQQPRPYNEYGVEWGSDIGLHLTAFSKKYNRALTGDPSSIASTPILDDWLLYAPMKATVYSDLNGPDIFLGSVATFDTKLFSFYYGYFMKDHDHNYANGAGWDARDGLACAAWRRVSNTSANKIQPGKAFLLWLGSGSGTGSPSADNTGRDESEMLAMASGTTLSALSSSPWKGNTSTSITNQAVTTTTEGAVYDLQGRRVADGKDGLPSDLQRGVYIMNGKKIVVK